MKKSFFSTIQIAYISVFTAMSVVLNLFSFPIPFFMAISNKISFTYVINVLAGVFLGPIPGFLVGALGDGIAFIIKPDGAWLPLITLASGFSGLIPGLFFKIKKLNPYIKIGFSLVVIFLVCTVTLNSLAIYYVYIVGKKTFFAFLATRLPPQSVMFVINAILILLLYPSLRPSLSKTLNMQKREPISSQTYEQVDKNNSEKDLLS